MIPEPTQLDRIEVKVELLTNEVSDLRDSLSWLKAKVAGLAAIVAFLVQKLLA